MELDCPICLETYDENAHSPIRLFCCSKTLCLLCLKQIASNTSACPWDKKRWVQRSVLKKCLENTPSNYLQDISSKYYSQDNNGKYNHLAAVCPLGDGSLKAEYENTLKRKHAEDLEQIKKDDLLAQQLSQEEEETLRSDQARREAMLLEDAKIATALEEKIKYEGVSHESLKNNDIVPPHRPLHRKQDQDKASIGGMSSRQKNRVSSINHQTHGIMHYFGSRSCDNSRGNHDMCNEEQHSNFEVATTHRRGTQANKRKPYLETSSSKKKYNPGLHTNPSGLSHSDLSHDHTCHAPPEPVVGSSQTTYPLKVLPSKIPSWNCVICTFSNFGLLDECEICGKKREIS